MWFEEDQISDEPTVERYGLDPRAVAQKSKWCAADGRFCTYDDCLYCDDEDDPRD